MNCEICGTEISGEPYKVKIDNTTMNTCKECSKYGKVQRKPQPKVTKKTPNKNNFRSYNNQNNQNNYKNKPTRRPREDEYELVEDYNTIIRHAREQQNLTQKKLGEKIYERESVINHIESGKMVPDNRLAKKIEKVLKIKIIEKVETDEQEFRDVKRYREATIGDIANIKRI